MFHSKERIKGRNGKDAIVTVIDERCGHRSVLQRVSDRDLGETMTQDKTYFEVQTLVLAAIRMHTGEYCHQGNQG